MPHIAKKLAVRFIAIKSYQSPSTTSQNLVHDAPHRSATPSYKMPSAATATIATHTQEQQPKLKLRNNPLDTEKTLLIEALSRKLESQAGSYGDWRDDLFRDGYVVVKGALEKEKALDYRTRMLKWLKAMAPEIDVEDPSTWDNDKLPDHRSNAVYYHYNISHEKFFWDLRQEPSIKGLFAKLWGTEELLVSFDAVNFSFPGIKQGQRKVMKDGWPHVDQSPYRNGLCCVQGISQLCESGPKDGSLVVFKNSHKLMERFFREVYPPDRWPTKDWCTLTSDQLQWFVDNGAEYVKIEAEPGDFILWDSRTVHWGQQPEDDAPNVRTIAYTCYTPAEWATEEQLQKKRGTFDLWCGTTHWPHDNIATRLEYARLANGEQDPKDIGKPMEMPALTDDLLKLAGVKPY